MSKDRYHYNNLLREKLQRDMILFLRGSNYDSAESHDLRKLLKSTGATTLAALSGNALRDFASKAVAIMYPEEPVKKVKQEDEVKPKAEPKPWLTFDEVCLDQEKRDPDFLSGEELRVTQEVLSVARSKLDEDALRAVLYSFTGTNQFALSALKREQGYELSSLLLAAILEHANA